MLSATPSATHPTDLLSSEPIVKKRGRKPKMVVPVMIPPEKEEVVVAKVADIEPEVDTEPEYVIVSTPAAPAQLEKEKSTDKPKKRKTKTESVPTTLAEPASTPTPVQQPPPIPVIMHLQCSSKDVTTDTDCFTFTKQNPSCPALFATDTDSNQIRTDSQARQHLRFDIAANETPVTTGAAQESKNMRDIWKKIRELEYYLHTNTPYKKSACFWCAHDFDNPAVYIPKFFMKQQYHVYGCFCCPECAVAYLMTETVDTAVKFERLHLLNFLYSKIYNYTKGIKPAPNPHYLLERFMGNLSIHEYRKLINNERLLLIVDKPLTRIMPELHEENDEFMVSNKSISKSLITKRPSMFGQLKTSATAATPGATTPAVV